MLEVSGAAFQVCEGKGRHCVCGGGGRGERGVRGKGSFCQVGSLDGNFILGFFFWGVFLVLGFLLGGFLLRKGGKGGLGRKMRRDGVDDGRRRGVKKLSENCVSAKWVGSRFQAFDPKPEESK